MTGDRSVNEDEDTVTSGPQHARMLRALSTSTSISEDDASAVSNDMALLAPNSLSSKISPDAASAVQVAVRVRPLLSSLESGCGSCITILPTHLDHSTTIQIGPESGPTFTFDEVFPTTTAQLEVFEHKVAPLVERCLEGYNATILAYGQTGSGEFLKL
jgi:Kinesin motor domain